MQSFLRIVETVYNARALSTNVDASVIGVILEKRAASVGNEDISARSRNIAGGLYGRATDIRKKNDIRKRIVRAVVSYTLCGNCCRNARVVESIFNGEAEQREFLFLRFVLGELMVVLKLIIRVCRAIFSYELLNL